jgi:hypothetical protein
MQKLQFRPGINREITSLTNEGGWYDGNKVRFRAGFPQKIGGWAPLSSNTFLGTASALWNWITLKGYNLLAVGTELKYYIENGGEYFDVTPIRETTAPGAATFVATNGSSIVTVNDANSGVLDGDFVTFSGAVSLGGNVTATVLNTEFQVTYISPNSYTINISPTVANASDVGNGGGSTVAEYQINTGVNQATALTGWGSGLWGGFTYTTVTTTLSSPASDVATTLTVVSTTDFDSTGVLLIGMEYISYSGKTPTTFTGCTRGVDGTTAEAHLAGDLVYDPSSFTGWGQSALPSSEQRRLWSQANFGDYLIINPRGGALYMWVPSYTTNGIIQFNTRAQELSFTSAGIYQTDAFCPTKVNFIMVSDASRFVITFGCTPINEATLDPMLVRWSGQENYAVWNPTEENQAGGYRLSSGSSIITAIQTRQEILIWTDAAVYSMQYLGPPYVWGFQILSGGSISIAGPGVVSSANNITYWMGVDKFYYYSGRTDTLPCAVREYVFNDINLSQSDQFFSGTNEGFNEIWWFYCSGDSLVIDRYVIFNYLENAWTYGTMARSAWIDSPLRDYPMATTYNNTVVFHENGADDIETEGNIVAIDSYIESADFNLGEGDNYSFVWQMIPDISFMGSTTPDPSRPQVTMTLRPRRNPGAPYAPAPSPTVASDQSYADTRVHLVQEFTEVIHTRVRGRSLSMKIRSNTIGTQWQLGSPTINIRPDGRR